MSAKARLTEILTQNPALLEKFHSIVAAEDSSLWSQLTAEERGLFEEYKNAYVEAL